MSKRSGNNGLVSKESRVCRGLQVHGQAAGTREKGGGRPCSSWKERAVSMWPEKTRGSGGRWERRGPHPKGGLGVGVAEASLFRLQDSSSL